MSRVYELRDVLDAPWLLERLEAFLERKRARANDKSNDFVCEAEIPHEFARFAIGNEYGRHRETISRREVRKALIPGWFDPRINPGQFAYISPAGLRVYIEVELNIASRNAPSVFETKIRSLVEPNPQPISLFDEVNETPAPAA